MVVLFTETMLAGTTSAGISATGVPERTLAAMAAVCLPMATSLMARVARQPDFTVVAEQQ